MDVVIAAVGKPKRPGLAQAIAEYEKRVERYFRFRAVEVRAAGLPDDEAERAREREAESLLRVLPDGLERVALTREGEPMSTPTFARYLEELATYGHPGVAFLIGGAHGLSQGLLADARHRLSLSSMTLTHELARLVLTEQLYRAGTLLRGEPYHKGR
jgi:23S rRNA (pseudouridine1915-N3)-methyltransferase